MSEFKYVRAASFGPTICAFCGTHEGPFVDTELDLPGYGHVYICAARDNASGCLRQMARLDGMVEAETVSATMQAMQSELDEAKAALAAEQDQKVVALPDLHKVLKGYGLGKRHKEPEPMIHVHTVTAEEPEPEPEPIPPDPERRRWRL